MSVDTLSSDDGITVTVGATGDPAHNMVEVVKNTITAEMSKFLTTQNNTNTLVSNRLKNIDAEILILNETADAAMNQANRHILLISGLKGSLAKDRAQKNKQANEVAEDFLHKISAGKVDLNFPHLFLALPTSRMPSNAENLVWLSW